MGSQQSVREIGELLAGRRFLVAGVALTVVFVALLSTFFVPRHYESETRVRLLDNEALHAAYGRGAANAPQRAAVIGRFRGDLTGRDTILAAVDGLDLEKTLSHLSPTERAAKREEIVATIRDGTTIEVLPGDAGEYLFRVVARGSDPELSRRILTHLVTGYQRRKFEEREQGGASEYARIREEVAATDIERTGAVKSLSEFVKAHPEQRFGESTDTASRLSTEKSALTRVQKQIGTLGARLLNIREQLADEQEWRDLEDGEESASGKVKNEVWKDLKTSERALVSEIAVKQRMKKAHGTRVAELASLVREFPALEAKWKELVRTEADLGERLASLRKQEKEARENWQARAANGALVFDVLDAPTRPGTPAGNQRLLVSLVGLVVGLCGGVGTVVFMGMVDKSFHRSDEVAGAFDVPVLGAIARIETPVERDEGRKRKRRAAVAVLVLAVLVSGALVAQVVFDEPISSFVRDVVSL